MVMFHTFCRWSLCCRCCHCGWFWCGGGGGSGSGGGGGCGGGDFCDESFAVIATATELTGSTRSQVQRITGMVVVMLCRVAVLKTTTTTTTSATTTAAATTTNNLYHVQSQRNVVDSDLRRVYANLLAARIIRNAHTHVFSRGLTTS